MTNPFTGQPSPPSRGRPTRRSRPKPAGPVGDPQTHLGNLSTALAQGNHLQAKSHAFALIRSLPKVGQADGVPPITGPSAADDPTMTPAMPMAVPKATMPTKPKAGNPARLASALKAMKKPAAMNGGY